MPQNTPMKRQFTTIDGRTVMSNLPQHWGGNDWAITGVDNPLPVGNYVQTKSGVWIPQKGSDDGAADVRLTGSIVEEFNVVEDQELPAGEIYTYLGTPVDKKGASLGLLITLENRIEFSVQISWRTFRGNFAGWEEVATGSGRRIHVRVNKRAAKYRVRIENKNPPDGLDTMIEEFSITEFAAGGETDVFLG